MKNTIFLLSSALLFGCTQEKTQTNTKSPDTVIMVQPAATNHTGTTTTTGTKSPQEKKDVIDKTNDALDKANKTVTKSSETIDKAAELKRKTDDLLNKPR